MRRCPWGGGFTIGRSSTGACSRPGEWGLGSGGWGLGVGEEQVRCSRGGGGARKASRERDSEARQGVGRAVHPAQLSSAQGAEQAAEGRNLTPFRPSFSRNRTRNRTSFRRPAPRAPARLRAEPPRPRTGGRLRPPPVYGPDAPVIVRSIPTLCLVSLLLLIS
ncbi:hypothetical protein CALCODRAFT_306946 [Calocera cornea HHB12733]|uniref:Uncharacterized protein n=1 Tax=Calocera cornea HHB12733 TaxID=1353952 RepID=A0A165JMG7_9BASI|nr:hypothetical protein CALCODRAFT_306946 [Calocera cornea HHB12733]